MKIYIHKTAIANMQFHYFSFVPSNVYDLKTVLLHLTIFAQ
jgi:hypothetical protein